MKRALISLHIAAASMLIFALWSGPPMGESEAHPWDAYAAASLATFFVFCPIGYLAISKSSHSPRTASAISILSIVAAASALAFGVLKILT
jgi:hypothetical protein